MFDLCVCFSFVLMCWLLWGVKVRLSLMHPVHVSHSEPHPCPFAIVLYIPFGNFFSLANWIVSMNTNVFLKSPKPIFRFWHDFTYKLP